MRAKREDESERMWDGEGREGRYVFVARRQAMMPRENVSEKT